MQKAINKIIKPSPLQLGMIFGLLVALVWVAVDTGISSANGEINTTADNVAIEGYDTVAYFTQRKAVKGSTEYSHRWKNAIWQFASAENLNLFANNPEKFAPQYGGY
jgi:hypothetical protein